MVTREELEDAIRDCESSPPSYDACRKLAVFYTVLEHLYGEGNTKSVDHCDTPSKNVVEPERIIGYYGNSEFLRMVYGMESSIVWAIMDELMDTLSIINPRLYGGVLRRINTN